MRLRAVLLVAVLAAAGPAQAAVPFYVYAPWTSGVTMYVGGPGYFYGQGTHVGTDHYAVDINGLGGGNTDCGQAIRATSGGTVVHAEAHATGYGQHVKVDHGAGYVSHYAHLQSIAVGFGQRVGHGDVLGAMGRTGNADYCHLHFVIYLNGNSVPPSPMSGVALWDGVKVTSNNAPDPPPPPPPSDTTPPSTSASLAGTPGDSGWWRSSVVVSLSASDGGSGVARTLARVDGGAWFQYGGPFGVGGEGSHRAEYHSVDNAGNQEGVKASTFAIDTVAPLTTHVLAGLAGDAGWWRSAVSVSLAASDATSGVASTSATRDGAGFAYGGPFGIAADGNHALSYRSRDRAGNVEPDTALEVAIDATPPTTSLAHEAPFHEAAQLYASSATPFSLAASDATSGVRGSAWSWRGAEQGYAGPFTLAGPDGLGSLAWRSLDVAGNAEEWRSQEVFLDNTPPSLALAGPAEDAIVASLDPVPLEAEASDAGSGVARVEFLVDGALRATDASAPYAWAWPAGDEALGDHTLEVRAFDHLGHATHVARNVTTVPTSQAGAEATARRAAAQAQEAADPAALQARAAEAVAGAQSSLPRLPVLGLVVEADPAAGSFRLGVTVDGAFVGLEG